VAADCHEPKLANLGYLGILIILNRKTLEIQETWQEKTLKENK